jgi:hypothetical protein
MSTEGSEVTDLPHPGAGFSEWIVYVDESGDHGVAKIDPGYPVFVLLFVLFRKNAYINRFVPGVGSLKFRWFGHDGVILHERDLRKDEGAFGVLRSPGRKELFFEELNQIIDRAPFEVLAAVHDKRRLAADRASIGDLYHDALRFGLERLHQRLHLMDHAQGITHVVCECRGSKEDTELKAAFRKACEGANAHACHLPFELVMTDKRANSVGLQLADLIARPVGLSVVRPEQTNRALDLIRAKLMPGPAGEEGWGLKCFP